MTPPVAPLPGEVERIARLACGCLSCRATLVRQIHGNQTPCSYEEHRFTIQSALAARERETVERCVAICAENGGDNGMAIRIARAIRAEFRALASPAPTRKCNNCGKPATCFGRHEDMPCDDYSCDDCCGHGDEMGRCEPLASPAPEVGG